MATVQEATAVPVGREVRRSGLMDYFQRRSRLELLLTIAGLLLLVATADYLTGFELSFSAFYLVPISLVTWFLGWRLGLLVCISSVTCALIGDMAAGALYSSHFVPMWNAVITIVFYLVVVVALSGLRGLHQQLENKVRERTAALRLEMAERSRLEKALLVVSEREQRRIGNDLHDSLCQHLTGAALAGQVLESKLEVTAPTEAADAERLVALIEDGIELARNIARGLSPVELDAEGLMTAFREFAKVTSERFGIDCRLELPAPVLVNNATTAMHLFRIAQEAVTNAIKHGHARHVIVKLKREQECIELTVHDDGVGLPDPLPASRGMGLYIMKHRATIIDATFKVERVADGTLVTCTTCGVPQSEDDL